MLYFWLLPEQLFQKILVDVGYDLAHASRCYALVVPLLQLLPPTFEPSAGGIRAPELDKILRARVLMVLAGKLKEGLQSVDIQVFSTLFLLLVELLMLLEGLFQPRQDVLSVAFGLGQLLVPIFRLLLALEKLVLLP